MSNDKVCILVTGVTGQLGFDIVKELNKRNISCIGVGSKDLDITNKDDVEKFFANHNISHVIHCAAYTKVDMAEDEKELNHKVNVIGTQNIVNECKKSNLTMMYFSTDYVYSGLGETPFKENDELNPIGEYAKSKLDGEKIVKELEKYFILRISWVFGKNGNNFIKTMVKLSSTKTELKIVSDQIGSPTYTVDAAKVAVDMIETDKYGIYNVTNEGFVSWADLAREIFKLIGADVKVYDISTEEYNAKASRPKNSRLDKSKLVECGFNKLPTWQDALDRYLKEENFKK